MQKAYDENYQTFLKKNTDYGSSFEESLNEFGEVAGVVWTDDNIIVEHTTRKVYSPRPRIEIEVEEVE